MKSTDRDDQHIEQFFKGLSPIAGALGGSSLSLLALRGRRAMEVVRARVFLSSANVAPSFSLDTHNLRARRYILRDLALEPRELLSQVMSGSLELDGEHIQFSGDRHDRRAPFHVQFMAEGLAEQRRLSSLSISGGDMPNFDPISLDWEVRASEKPYNGLAEVLGEIGLPSIVPGPCVFEFIQQNVAQIDLGKTQVSGANAHVEVRVAPGLSRDKFRIGYRVQDGARRVVERNSISGDGLTWSSDDGFDRASVDFVVPQAAVVKAVAVYDGVAQHYWWFDDPKTSQNPRRASLQTFDPDFSIIRDAAERALGRNPEARTFESAVGWVFWMLGFSPVHTGAMAKVSEVPDHIVVSPSGNVMVVEVTTGLPKAENKLAILHDRCEAVRRSLRASNHGHVKVLPVMVTTKTRTEIAVDQDQADRLGIFIITRDEFGEILNRSLLLPDAEALFSEISNSVADARERLN